MKKYLNPLFFSPILGFLIPILLSFLFTLGDISKNFLGGSIFFGIGLLLIGLLNIWHYNICVDSKNSYMEMVYFLVVMLSVLFFFQLISKSSDSDNSLIMVIPIYILGLIMLIGSNIHTHIKVLRGQDNIPITNEQLSITNEQLPIIISKKGFFSWVSIPLFVFFVMFLYYIIPFYLLKDGTYLYFMSGILFVRYFIIFIINKKLLSNSMIYKGIMVLTVLFMFFGVVPNLYKFQSIIEYNSMFILSIEGIIVCSIISLLLLMLTCVTSNILYKRKLLQIK